jgi:hypothetical protein
MNIMEYYPYKIDSPFAGVRAYSPSPERDPRNNIRDNCWLKAIPKKAKANAIGSMDPKPCNHWYPYNSNKVSSLDIQLGSFESPSVRNVPVHRSKTRIAMPKPIPYKLARPTIEQTLEQWEVQSIISDYNHSEDDDNEGSFSDCFLELLRQRFSWIYEFLYDTSFENESMEAKLDRMRDSMGGMNIENN